MPFEKLSEFLQLMAAERTTGCAVSVIVGGKEVFREAYGYSSVETETPMTGDELFFIYSCSKITTVVAALTLLERGRFLLSDPLYEYIPEFRNMTVRMPDGSLRAAKVPIRILDLFTMTAGFDYNLKGPFFEQAGSLTKGAYHTLDTVKCLAQQPLQFEPGERWNYSLCHDVLAGLVEAISGMKFRDYVKKMIFDPLDMHRSFYHPTPELLPHIAEQYQFVPAGERPEEDPVKGQRCGKARDGNFINVGKQSVYIFGPEYDSGGAGIISCLDDYGKLLSALANQGLGQNGNRILSKHTVRLLCTNALSAAQLEGCTWPQLAGYGYGLGVRTMLDPIRGGSLSPLGESGWCGAAGSAAFFDPTENAAMFFVQHTLNSREEYFMPRLRNALYACL